MKKSNFLSLHQLSPITWDSRVLRRAMSSKSILKEKKLYFFVQETNPPKRDSQQKKMSMVSKSLLVPKASMKGPLG